MRTIQEYAATPNMMLFFLSGAAQIMSCRKRRRSCIKRQILSFYSDNKLIFVPTRMNVKSLHNRNIPLKVSDCQSPGKFDQYNLYILHSGTRHTMTISKVTGYQSPQSPLRMDDPPVFEHFFRSKVDLALEGNRNRNNFYRTIKNDERWLILAAFFIDVRRCELGVIDHQAQVL
ncbi:hypothetical protein H2248_001596 [Termitomyces sp. 'cryptogamus']|nr:hypothetical protein H2248_001596 [Termitomyces sp. 'cryptogamus']